MRRNNLALFVHLVWATWDRLPLLTPELERPIYRCLASEVQGLKAEVVALNGMPDHVHLVIRLPATVTIADLVKQIKGASSRFVNETLQPQAHFKWQGSYGAFSVSPDDVDHVVEYVQRQKEHHQLGDLWPEWEEAFAEFAADSET